MNFEELETAEIIILGAGGLLGLVLLFLGLSLAWNGLKAGSLLAATWILIGAVLAWPPAEFYRRRMWEMENLKPHLEDKKPTLIGSVILTLASAAGFLYNLPLDSLLLLPFRIGGGALYAAVLQYRDVLGSSGSMTLFKFGQWTLQLIWVYLIADIAAGVLKRFLR